jgi:hypothetical protein
VLGHPSIVLLIALFALPVALCSQSAAPLPEAAVNLPGSIHGVVMDRDGTVCEGALITLELSGPAAGKPRSAISASDGRYLFGDLPPGSFKLTISSQGFATQVITGQLHSGESYEAPPITILVNRVQSEVQVTASQQEIGLEQVREEEHQRVLGLIPNFFVSYAPDAPPLTSRQKFYLAWKSSIDPVTLLGSGFIAGVEQASNTYSGFGQGTEGYAKRFGANYADNFIGTMLGGALLPSLLKQDPRYFYKGTGSKRSRIFYAISSSVICRSDSGHRQADYSGIIGSFAGAGISNLYYPAANRNGMTLTLENVLAGKASGAIQNLFQEFVVRRLTPKLPDYGSTKQ